MRKGFTLIELILVIAILGILAISALPKFLDVSDSAKAASRDGVVGAVRAGIALYKAEQMVTTGGTGSYPTTLDSASDAQCSPTNLCFGTVLTTGVDETDWVKAGNVYTHTVKAGDTKPYTYTGGTGEDAGTFK